MTLPEPTVLLEDNHLLVINKPAPLATMGAEAGEPTAVEWARDYLKRQYHKPGNVYIGVVSRLDAFVTGVLPLARTSKAAARLTAAFSSGSVDKRYVALVEGVGLARLGRFDDSLRHNDAARCVEVSAGPGSQAASLEYEVLAENQGVTLVAIRLITGRKHQIRVQFSHRGFPILGDRKYGGRPWKGTGIALHAQRITFPHPTRQEPVTVEAPLPDDWPLPWRQAWQSSRG